MKIELFHPPVNPAKIQPNQFNSALLINLGAAALITLPSCLGDGAKDEDNQKSQKPNIVYILTDDLGYGDVGCYGQKKIETPNIDELAENGIRFTQHYSGSPVCAPSRCVLMTGMHTGHAYIRGNDAWGERGEVWNFEKASKNPRLEGQRPIPDETVTIAEVLQKEGYTTGVVGKWGLGAPFSEGVPNKQGFDFFYGYNCQRQAHTYYPLHLWKNGEKDTLDNRLVPPHTELPEDADPYDPESYSDFRLTDYAPDLMIRETINFLERNQQNPFFLYYATPIPHLPLQAPKRWVDHYVEKFGDEEPYTGDNGYFPCRYPRATYAAMISYMDENVGKIVDKLKEMGVYENTLIIFTSDNGPTYTGGADTQWFNSAGPFKEETGWTKGYVHEGGIRVPMIASWPGKIQPGTVTDHVSAFWDVFPTLCDVAGTHPPQDLNIDGISYLPTLLGKENQKKHELMYWEFPSYNGQQAVRFGKWKAIRENIFDGNMEIQLYNMETDSTEQNNIADQHPEVVKKARRLMEREHETPKIEKFRMDALSDTL